MTNSPLLSISLCKRTHTLECLGLSLQGQNPTKPSLMASSSASSFSSLSRRLSHHLLPAYSNPKPLRSFRRFCTTTPEPNPELEIDDSISDAERVDARPDESSSQQQRLSFQRPLEKGLDQGVYKAILVGKVGQKPIQKRLRSGRPVTLFSLGTGGIRNNRRPLDDEDPKEYANRCAVQWHRVSVYPERLGDLALKHVNPGAMIYVEGNLETKIFSDPISGIVKRIREVAIRRDGRLVFLDKEGDAEQSAQRDLKGVGYY